MPWKVNASDEFAAWFDSQTEECQASVAAKVRLLEEHGPNLRRPHVGTLDTERDVASRHTHMKELIVQHHGDPYRILFAFDTSREGILLVGGCKAGNDRWYADNIPIADRLLDDHERELEGRRRAQGSAQPKPASGRGKRGRKR